MARRYTAAELESMTAAERAEAVKASVTLDPNQVSQNLLQRGRERLAARFAEIKS